jgi:hypothetical protein
MSNTANFAKLSGSNVVKYEFNNSNHLICDGYMQVVVDHFSGEALANVFALSFITRQNWMINLPQIIAYNIQININNFIVCLKLW